MKVLGLDLDNSPEIAENKSLRYAENITIDNKFSSYFNDPGFRERLGIAPDYQICGTIPTNIGFVLFCVNNGAGSDAILYFDSSTDKDILKIIITGNFGFSIDHPITGDYIYNYKGDLIVVFTDGIKGQSETRIININNPLYIETDDPKKIRYSIKDEELPLFNLAPNVSWPTINTEVSNGGHLKTGAYQIALAYKLPDGTYTNYSTLTPTVIIAGNYPDDNPIGAHVSNNIIVSLTNLDGLYDEFKLAIIYIDEESQTVYETNDVKYNKTSDYTHIINELSGLTTISLDDIFIKNINYIKDETLLNFHNRLYRGNTQTADVSNEMSAMNDIVKKIKVHIKYNHCRDFYNTNIPYFKTGEVYLLYAAFYNSKGDLLNILPIPCQDNNDLYLITTRPYIINSENNIIRAHLIPSINANHNPYEDETSSLDYRTADPDPDPEPTPDPGITPDPEPVIEYGYKYVALKEYRPSNSPSIYPTYNGSGVAVLESNNFDNYLDTYNVRYDISSADIAVYEMYKSEAALGIKDAVTHTIDKVIKIYNDSTNPEITAKILFKFNLGFKFNSFIRATINFKIYVGFTVETFRISDDTFIERNQIDIHQYDIKVDANSTNGLDYNLDGSLAEYYQYLNISTNNYCVIFPVVSIVSDWVPTEEELSLGIGYQPPTIKINNFYISIGSNTKSIDATESTIGLSNSTTNVDNVVSTRSSGNSTAITPIVPIPTIKPIAPPIYPYPLPDVNNPDTSDDSQEYGNEGNDNIDVSAETHSDSWFCPMLYPVIDSNELTNILTKYNSDIKYISFLYAEHNELNSRILSQGIIIKDTEINSFANSQSYDYPFEDDNKVRLYAFDLLFNKKQIINFKPIIKYSHIDLEFKSVYDKLDIPIRTILSKHRVDYSTSNRPTSSSKIDDYREILRFDGLASEETNVDPNTITNFSDKGKKDDHNNLVYRTSNLVNDSRGTCLADITIDTLVTGNRYNWKTTNYLAEYVSANNSAQDNTAGDSFYRIKDAQHIAPYGDKLIIIDLLNTSNSLYSSYYNQNLQIASSIYKINDLTKEDFIKLKGDTYLSTLALRATTPSMGYLYGDNNNKDLDGNNYIYRWVFSVPIESKYNIAARFSKSAVDKSFKPTQESDLYDYFKVNYKVDNFINIDEGKGYSKIYNENGIEKFTYFENIDESQNHPYRVIRSQEITSESLALNWRIFKTNDYKDMPFNRGEIVSLKGDTKSIYIQQKYGLQLLQLKDTINNDESNTSYLGTADIFNLDPQEILFSPTGYIGCENSFDTTINANGYYVVDSVHKKIFHVYGTKVSEISNINTAKWFNQHLKVLDNNPYDNHGRYFVFNELNNILYLIQQNDFNLSFSPIINKWISFHSYKPTIGLYNRNGLVWINNNIIYTIDPILRNIYLKREPESSYLKFILNEYPQYNKILNSIVWKDRVDRLSSGNLDFNDFYKTISKICVLNDSQCTNYKDVQFNDIWYDGSTGVNKINNWRFNNINDIVKNNRNPIINKDALVPDIAILDSNMKNNPKWYDINKFISQFVYCILKYDSKHNNDQWELIDIEPQFDLDNRNRQK